MPAPRGVFALLSCLLITVAAGSAGTPAGLGTPNVAWPPSGGLSLAEVMTGGASASDEYVEIANAGSAVADLGGCELVYVTASGSTITRKAVFTAPLPLVPGQHLLVANSAGIYGPLGDDTYTGGLAADGGAVVLRKTDGTIIDAVGWGTAVNSYVEGAVAPAPPARSSIERRPGGSGGNLVDTNDNGWDFLIQPNPVPQSLASRPVPGASDAPSASPSDTPTASTPTEFASTTAPLPSPSATPSDSATPAAILASSPASAQTEAPAPTGATETETPTAQPTGPAETETPTAESTGQAETAEPTAATGSTATATATGSTATATATATDTGAPTAAPTATATSTPTPSPRSSAAPSSPATPGPTPTLRPSPTLAPTPDLGTIAAARLHAIGVRVRVRGVITAVPGLVGAGLFAIEDSSAGIFVRVATSTDGLTEGRQVEVDGTLAAPYGQLEIRDLGELIVGADQKGWPAQPVGLSEIGEGIEGLLVSIAGTVDSVQTDNGRLTVTVSDGQSVVRVLADPPVGLSRADLARGDEVVVSGIVGQRATATGRLDGYRLWPRRRTDVVVQRPVEPTPTATPSDAAGPIAGPTETELPTASPTRPSQTFVYYDLASALGTRGADVDVEAVVTAKVGLLDIGAPTIVVDDGSAAAAVILPAGTSAPGIGMRVRVTGKVGRWEGGPTVLAASVDAEGQLSAVTPLITSSPLDGSLEWQLVQVCGRIDRYTPAGTRWRLEMLVGGNEMVILGEPAAGISMKKDSVGRIAVVVGIVRRSTSDASAFQVLPRLALDVRLGPAPAPAPVAKGTSGVTRVSDGTPAVGLAAHAIEIGSAPDYLGQAVTVSGIVTETTSGTATIDDGSGTIRVGGLDAATAIAILAPGDAVEVTGVVNQDGEGLFIAADPDSVVDLPADGSDGSNEQASGAAGAHQLTAASGSAAVASAVAPDAMRRASSAITPPGQGLAVNVLVVVALLTGAVALGLAMLRRRPVAEAINRWARRRRNQASQK